MWGRETPVKNQDRKIWRQKNGSIENRFCRPSASSFFQLEIFLSGTFPSAPAQTLARLSEVTKFAKRLENQDRKIWRQKNGSIENRFCRPSASSFFCLEIFLSGTFPSASAQTLARLSEVAKFAKHSGECGAFIAVFQTHARLMNKRKLSLVRKLAEATAPDAHATAGISREREASWGAVPMYPDRFIPGKS